MKKKALSLLLVAMMCGSMLPANAFATDNADTHANHLICNDSTCEDESHAVQNWQAINNEDDLQKINVAGTYYLDADVIIKKTWKPVNDVVLCLNGKKLSADGNFDTITIGDDITFTLTDCTSSGKVTHSDTSMDGRGILVAGTGTFNMYGGDITSNHCSKEGAGVQTCGTFNMYGGSITNNVLTAQYNYGGGGVCVGSTYSGSGEVRTHTFNMYNGVIANNRSYSAGGGVDMGSYSKFYMYNGSIRDNTASAGGGGVAVGDDTFVMTGGSITGNTCNAKNDTFTGGGVSIYNNAYSAPNFTISGNVTIINNKCGSGNNSKTDNVFLYGSDSSWGTSFTSLISIGEAGLSTDSQIGVNTAVKPKTNKNTRIVSENDTNYASNFSSDDGYSVVYNQTTKQLELVSEHIHYLCGGVTTCTGVGGHSETDKVKFTEWDSSTSLPYAAGNYYLTKDVELTSIWGPKTGTVLCLNGHSVTLKSVSSVESDYAVISTLEQGNKDITLTDCQPVGQQGSITHADGVYGPGAYITSDSKFQMCGGSITGNTSLRNTAGGVSVNGTFKMYGGSITDNSSNGLYGVGGVSMGTSGQFEMYGGSITDNHVSSGDGIGGIKFYDLAKNLTLGGNVTITGNTAGNKNSNVYLDNHYTSQTITVNDTLRSKSRIGVTSYNTPTADSPVAITTGGGNYYSQFTSDNSNYYTENDNGNVVLKFNARQEQAPLTLYLSNNTVAYDDSLTVDVLGGSGTGAVTYQVTNDTGYAAINDNVLTAKKVGIVKVKAIKAGDTNYFSAESTEATVTITKAKPTGTPEYTKITENGKTLADAELKIGAITPVGGTIAWNAGDETTVEANKSYGWTYMPADANNYEVLRGTITPYVVAHSSGSHSTGSSTPKYTISAPSGTTGGTVKSNVSSAAKGSTVTVTVTPQDGYKLDKLIVTDSKGNTLTVTDKGDNKYTFTMPSSKVTVTPTFSRIEETKPETSPFDDVTANDYFYDAVNWAADKGITGGMSDTLFAPNAACTRAQIVTFLWRTAGSPESSALSNFNDVPADKYYAKAVAWAVENGITNGTTDTTFSPDDICTRAHGVTFLYRAAKATASVGASAFTDVADSAYYADAVKWATEQGITKGISSTLFGPDETCTRAQIVTFLYRMYGSK